MGKLRTKLTYANIVATLSIVLVLSGGTAVAVTGGNFLLGKANSASSKTSLSAPIANKALQITNSDTDAGATALGLTTAHGNPPLIVNSATKVEHLNADQLDGRDSTTFGRVRDFSRSCNATSCDLRDMVSLEGLTLSSNTFINGADLLTCDLEATATSPGQFDNAWIFQAPPAAAFALSAGTSTPADHFFVARARGDGSRSVGQLVFRNGMTDHTVTVAYAVHGIADPDVNLQGCTFEGTVTAAG
ncbi:MAG: hypothetical protein ACJ77A_01020 [Actinomycetota bacterium]